MNAKSWAIAAACLFSILVVSIGWIFPSHRSGTSRAAQQVARPENLAHRINRRSDDDNSTDTPTDEQLFAFWHCRDLVPLNGSLQTLLQKFSLTDDYIALLRISVTVVSESGGDGTTSDDLESILRSDVWHWGLGGRGNTLLHYPYDNKTLSLHTLGYGIHAASVTLQDTTPSNESLSDPCVAFSLSKLLRQVRREIHTSEGDLMKDVICKIKHLHYSTFRGTYIPGSSLFELQASSLYECWHMINITNCDENVCLKDNFFQIECTTVIYSFVMAIGLILLILCVYGYRIITSRLNGDEDQAARQEDTVNILRIRLIPPSIYILTTDNKKWRKAVHLGYWFLVYLVPLLFYLIVFLCYIAQVDEYQYRSNLRGYSYKARVWGLDMFFANILYAIGLGMFLCFVWKYKLDNEIQHDLRCVKKKKVLYFFIALLCFWRFFAILILSSEIIILTFVGIAIHFSYVSPVWINCIAVVLVVVANVIRFFDSYYSLFNKVYSVGMKIDREEHPRKIFPHSDAGSAQAGSPQTQFLISTSLLRSIIRKWLPFSTHFFRTVWHIVLPAAFLLVVGIVVAVIDQKTDVRSSVEYIITIIPIGLAGAAKLKGNHLSASSKHKNSARDNLYRLEEDLRTYARTGNFPVPDGSCWGSCCAMLAYCRLCLRGCQDDADAAPRTQTEGNRPRPNNPTTQNTQRSNVLASDIELTSNA